jgi:signal transduction histidine kinase
VIELGNLAVIYAVAIVVGQRVESEQRARHRAEAALEAAVTEQHRRQEEQRAFSGRLLAVQEEERRKLAQDLHDDPLQHLMYLTRALDDLSEDTSLPARLAQVIQHDGELAAEAAAALRKVIHGLRPPILDDIGITPALRQLVAEVRKRSTLNVILHCTGTENGLPPEVKLTAYRIVQESLNNVMRHAQARRATIRVRFANPLTLTISDDGRGIPPTLGSADGPQPGLGLIGMRERATLAGGTLRVSKRSPHGTVVQATLPSGQPSAPEDRLDASGDPGAPG